MKRIEMFTRYTAMGASSRYRFYKYVVELLRDGFDVNVSPFFDNIYLERLYSGRGVRLSGLTACYIRRLGDAIRARDNILLEYELFPFIPYAFERLFLNKKKYILNFDDNVWDKYCSRMFLKDKFDRLTAKAAGVVVANEFLLERVKKLNSNVIKIPTALDIKPYQRVAEKFPCFTIVWIGTPVTYKYLLAAAPVFQRLSASIDYELLVIARKDLESQAIKNVNMRFVNWSEESESYFIPRAHVGVMPLDDDEFSRGKSAFKLFQYFASGLPVVASAVGENCHVVEEGVNGYLVDSPDQWVERLSQLYHSHETREALGRNAAKSSKKYSLEFWTPAMIRFIENTFRL